MEKEKLKLYQPKGMRKSDLFKMLETFMIEDKQIIWSPEAKMFEVDVKKRLAKLEEAVFEKKDKSRMETGDDLSQPSSTS